jgi:hypothetical protein
MNLEYATVIPVALVIVDELLTHGGAARHGYLSWKSSLRLGPFSKLATNQLPAANDHQPCYLPVGSFSGSSESVAWVSLSGA